MIVPAPHVIEHQDFSAWILRSSISGFTAGCRALAGDVPKFGDLVKVFVPGGPQIFGLIYRIEVPDEPIARQLIFGAEIEPEIIEAHRENRLTPIKINVLTTGYQHEGQPIIQRLPAQPPNSLNRLMICTSHELYLFTQNLLYLQYLLGNSRSGPIDELLIHHLRQAAACYPAEVRYYFLVGVGREIARLVSSDLGRLDRILKGIRPTL